MPLIATSDLPSFARLRKEGQEVLPPDRACAQDIRELHIGLLNMMPDAALEATERQFLRLIGASNRIAQFHVHLFTFAEIPRDAKAAAHIQRYYRDFNAIKNEGLDALILSGANPQEADLARETFWSPLLDAVKWARDNVCSVMCSCLATHAVAEELWGIRRYRLAEKRWGVYSNRVTAPNHPLTANINTRFDAPHSHLYEVNAAQFRERGLQVLAQSEESDLHLAASEDGMRFIFFQGHPEYDAVSLLKEYRREIARHLRGERDYPRLPENYFRGEALRLVEAYRGEVEKNPARAEIDAFPEAAIAKHLANTWSDTGKAIINNWLGAIYQVAAPERGKVFMDGVDPQNPLGLKA